MTWGMVTIYGGAAVASAIPRGVAAVVSLTGAYVAFGLLCAILSNLVVEDDEDEPAPEAVESTIP
jgi:hypothetical protein